MSRLFLTAAASRFCAENGRPRSTRTLQKDRTKAPDDPGEHGPRYYRDPVSGFAYYREEDLLAWCNELGSRLVERAPHPQPSQLASRTPPKAA